MQCKVPRPRETNKIELSEQRNKMSKSNTEVARKLFKSWDLQRGYDDIDWRDKLKEIVPEFAAALSTAQSDLAQKVLAEIEQWNPRVVLSSESVATMLRDLFSRLGIKIEE